MKAGLVGAFLVVGTLGMHGYASTNTVRYDESATTAGFGSASVSRLSVNNVKYGYDSVNKGQVISVTFFLSAAVDASGSDAVAWAQHNGTTWTSCGPVSQGATTVVCPISDIATAFGKDSNGDEAPLILVLAE